MTKHTATRAEEARRRLNEAAIGGADEYLRGSQQIAAYLGISAPTLLRMVHRGELPAFIVANKLVVSKALLDAWLTMKQQAAIADALERQSPP